MHITKLLLPRDLPQTRRRKVLDKQPGAAAVEGAAGLGKTIGTAGVAVGDFTGGGRSRSICAMLAAAVLPGKTAQRSFAFVVRYDSRMMLSSCFVQGSPLAIFI